jgi:hypothetical protein
MTNQAVSFWEVHEFVAPYLDAAAPMAGTPAWCALDDADPVKWAALLDAARHWALRVETCQQAECEASRAISAAFDWAAISVELHRRAEFYRQKPYLKRKPA